MTSATTTQYQFATLTTASPQAVLDGIAALDLPEDVTVTERGSTYLVIGPKPSAYDARLAVGLSTLVVLAVLILTAFWVVLAALLPLAVLPLVPLLMRDRPTLAAGAVPDDDGTTRVTLHGQAPVKLTDALDQFLSRLPVPAEPGDASGRNGSSGERNASPPAAAPPVRAPEPTAAE
jgi:hypothetical protein